MTLLLKDPSAELDYAVDWGAEYLDGDALADSSWSISPSEPEGAEVLGANFGQLVATVKVGGGIAGRVYRLTNQVELTSGLKDSRSIILRVEKR